MLNCLVNSIFHILFCIALAKVLKSSAVSPEPSVCDLCLPFFIAIFLHPPLNSPWKDFPCWKFWFRYDLWGIPIHCISIVLGLRCRAPLFSQLSPHYTGIHARNVGFHLSLSKFCATYMFKFVCSPKVGANIFHLISFFSQPCSFWKALWILNTLSLKWNLTFVILSWISILDISISRMVSSYEAEH